MLRTVLALVAAALALAAVPASAPAAVELTQSPLETSLLQELNKIRTSHGLRPLVASAPLSRAADAHAVSMGRLGYFSHTSADGTSFDRRIARFYSKTSYRSWMVGENLLYSSGHISSGEAVAMWLESPDHRRNILEPRWRSIGIAEAFAPHAAGVFEGDDVTLLVTDFGARS